MFLKSIWLRFEIFALCNKSKLVPTCQEYFLNHILDLTKYAHPYCLKLSLSIPIPIPFVATTPPPQPNLNVIYTGGINVCVRYLILKLRGVAWESSISHKCKKFYTKNLQNIYTFIYSRKTIWYLNYLKYLNLIEKFNHQPSFKCIILKTITTKFS